MMFEEGNRLRAKYGADKVFDFSLGNPSVPAPDSVREAIIDLVNNTDPTVLHGYMSNAGFEDVRQTIAESLNRRFDTKFSAKEPDHDSRRCKRPERNSEDDPEPGRRGDRFLHHIFWNTVHMSANYDGVLVEISPDTTTFQPNLAEFEQKITPKTKAVIVNTPHNTDRSCIFKKKQSGKLSDNFGSKTKRVRNRDLPDLR